MESTASFPAFDASHVYQFFKMASMSACDCVETLVIGRAGRFEELIVSIEIMSNVWKKSPHTGSDRLVLLCLADYANTYTGECFPSVPTILKRCLLNRRSVQRSLKSLIGDGSIQRIRIGGRYSGENVSSLYRFNEPYFFSRYKKQYNDYLLSDHWRELRAAVFSSASYCCEVCNSTSSLHGHHMVYRNPLSSCTPEDIMCLCERCHSALHQEVRFGRISLPKDRASTLSIIKDLSAA